MRFLSRWYGFQIPLKTNIGLGFYLGYHGTIIVNGNAVIGNNCNLSSGVIIGKNPHGRNLGVSTIGNNVWIGAHSIIIGKIKIGDNSHISPNCLANFDVPANSHVMGNVGFIKSNWTKTDSYIINKWEQEKLH